MAEKAATVAITMPDPSATTIDKAPNHIGCNATTISASNGGLGSPVAPAPVARIDFGDFRTDFTSPARPLEAQHVTNESPRQKNLSNIAQLESKFEEGYDSGGQAGP